MRYEEKELIAEEAINNRHKLKMVRKAPLIYFFNQIFIIILISTALILGTDIYWIYFIIPLILFFTFLFFKKNKISIICSTILLTTSLPIFLVLTHSTCIKKQNQPYNSIISSFAEEIEGEDSKAKIEELTASRNLNLKSDRNTANLIYIAATAESILIAVLTSKMLNEHEKLKLLDGYPLFEVDFDEEVDDKIKALQLKRKENTNNEYLQ